MVIDILFNNHTSIKNRLKNVVYYLSKKRGAIKSWKTRHRKVFNKNENYNESLPKKIEQKHKKLWGDFRRNVDSATLRICSNISGKTDPRIVPEDIFVSDLEPTLTTDASVNYLSNKSFYNKWFPDGLFPKDILHNIDGQYLDSNLNDISPELFRDSCMKINFPVVFKPNRGAYGGQGIHFVKNSAQLISLAEEKKDFVIQQQIKQHDFYNQYNSCGLNTFRVYLYRSVKNNNLSILTVALRMGVGGSLDNETAGGIHTMINEHGIMNGFAVDKFGSRYLEHPDSGLMFDKQIPDFEGLKKLSLRIGKQLFFTRIIGLDVCYDEDKNWRAIEVNTKGHTVRFSQYGGKPFFGDFTNEVIEFCKNNHWALK